MGHSKSLTATLYILPVLHIDFALEWVQVPAGQIIYRQGEPSNSIYIVLNGRLRTISERKEGGIDILGEFGHGDSVGELEVLSMISPIWILALFNFSCIQFVFTNIFSSL